MMDDKKNDFLVSIIITCYNYGNYVEESIKSALSQTYKNIEIIVINDGSTDNSINIINKYKDKLIIVDRENKGVVYTRNEGLKISKGDYIAFLDADDYFDSDYIENMLQIALKSGADVVYPSWRVFGDEDYLNTFSEFDIKKLIRQEIHCSSESLIKSSSVVGHKFESEIVAEDWDFFVGMALDNRKFKYAKDCFINYRVRKNTRGSARTYWDDMRYFYDILKKWNKRYPDIFDPIDLFIYSGKDRDRYIKNQSEHIKSLDEHIKGLDAHIKQADDYIINMKKIINSRDNTINYLNSELNSIKRSKLYRIVRAIKKSPKPTDV